MGDNMKKPKKISSGFLVLLVLCLLYNIVYYAKTGKWNIENIMVVCIIVAFFAITYYFFHK